MSFRLVQNSVSLNGLERRNSPQVCVILSNSVAFGAHYVKVVEDTPILSATEMYSEMYSKKFALSDISLMAILSGNER